MRPKKSILLVDGDSGRQEVFRFVLSTRGFSVHCESTAAAALELLDHSPYDVLIADLALSDMSGSSLALLAKRLRPGLPVLLYGKMPSRFVHASIADALIPLPATPIADLVERVRILTARKRGPKKGWKEALPHSSSAI